MADCSVITAPVTGAVVDGQADKVKYELNNGGKRITRICILGRKQDFEVSFTSRLTGTDPSRRWQRPVTIRPWLLRRASRWKRSERANLAEQLQHIGLLRPAVARSRVP